jgi:sugar/nucleoside kinase (ribokinase family)
VTVAALGDLLLDVSCRLAGPLARDTDTPSANRLDAGGQAANVAAWAGSGSRLIVRRADDPAGRLAEDRLRERGVEVLGPLGGGPCGCVVIVIDAAGGRTMLTDRGVAPQLDEHAIEPAWLAGVAWLHITGYALGGGPMLAAAERAAALVRAEGGRVSLDLANPEVAAAAVGSIERLAPDLLLGTTAELAAAEHPVAPIVVEKRGADGALLRSGSRVQELRAHPVEVVDTTGAGDALAGGLLAALACGAAPAAALERGLAAAAVCVGRQGAQPAGRYTRAAARM